MAGVSVEVDVRGLDPVRRMLSQLESIQLHDLLDTVGALIEGQTRRRIQKEKSAPDGKAWKPWSDKYALTRHENQSLLMSKGNLLDSIQHASGPGSLEEQIGSNLVYAAAQFYGYPPRNLPSRQALGISDANQDEIEGVVNTWLAQRLQP
jgi:phage gpG-like protein